MRWITLFVAASLAAACTSPREKNSVAQNLALVGVSVVDFESGRVLADQTVLIVGRHIRTVASDGSVDLPTRVKVADARGKFLISGLCDTHVHVTPF
jgi:adenine deaminase